MKNETICDMLLHTKDWVHDQEERIREHEQQMYGEMRRYSDAWFGAVPELDDKKEFLRVLHDRLRWAEEALGII